MSRLSFGRTTATKIGGLGGNRPGPAESILPLRSDPDVHTVLHSAVGAVDEAVSWTDARCGWGSVVFDRARRSSTGSATGAHDDSVRCCRDCDRALRATCSCQVSEVSLSNCMAGNAAKESQ